MTKPITNKSVFNSTKSVLIIGLIILTAILCSAVTSHAIEDSDIPILVEGNNKFAFDLYSFLNEGQGNLFFSPFSVSATLSMTYAGSRNETEQQIAEVMHFQQGQNILHEVFGSMQFRLNDPKDRRYELNMVNGLWLDKTFRFERSFLRLAKQAYHAKLKRVDFVNKSEQTRNKINKWVERATRKNVKDLIPEGVLNDHTKMVLTNTIYFKGQWDQEFDPNLTQTNTFFLDQTENIDTSFMVQEAYFNYMKNDNIQVIELPYIDEELSMIVILPLELDGLADLEQTLTPTNFETWLDMLTLQNVEVYLPKFKMGSDYSLRETLSTLGMPDLFTPAADLSGIIKQVGPSGITNDGNLYLSNVLHKAFIEVNEQGTEAAAATAAVFGVTAIKPNANDIPVFNADHPFLFMIKDNISGSILFMGRVVDPNQ